MLSAIGFRLWDACFDLRDADGRRQVYAGLAQFREHLGGELTITLLEAIGHGVEVHEMNLPTVVQAIHRLQERHAARTRKIVAVAG
mgnify:CR=1 FL=1